MCSLPSRSPACLYSRWRVSCFVFAGVPLEGSMAMAEDRIPVAALCRFRQSDQRRGSCPLCRGEICSERPTFIGVLPRSVAEPAVNHTAARGRLWPVSDKV